MRRAVAAYYRLLGVKVGKGVFISHTAKIDTTYPNTIEIGDGSYVTARAIVLSHDHSVYRHDRNDSGVGLVKLGRNVFVGAGAIVMRNVTIGDNAIIAAGSVVTGDIPANVIAAGNPARIVKSFVPLPNEDA
jgi:acetyltransferase-like isoleucine patch superfamily enzyme